MSDVGLLLPEALCNCIMSIAYASASSAAGAEPTNRSWPARMLKQCAQPAGRLCGRGAQGPAAGRRSHAKRDGNDARRRARLHDAEGAGFALL